MWLEALDLWRAFDSNDGCLNCRLSKERCKREGLYRCLMALERFGEAYCLYLDAWLSPRLTEFGEQFQLDLVRAAKEAGRTHELRELALQGNRWLASEILKLLTDNCGDD